MTSPDPLPPAWRPAFGAALAASTALVWAQLRRLAQARRACALPVLPYAQARPGASRRILLLGDSTGVGLGCEPARHSIAARLAADHADADITNLCRAGARVADLLPLAGGLPEDARFDLVLVLAGGNDVLRFTPLDTLARDADALLAALRRHSLHVVWAGMANVGRAPLFLPPFGWLLSARTRRVSRLLATAAEHAGTEFVDFYRDAAADPFSADPQRYYGRDRVHPSAEAYAWCYARMRPALARALSTARMHGGNRAHEYLPLARHSHRS